MRLSAEQVAGLAELASEGDDIFIGRPVKVVQKSTNEVVTYIEARRALSDGYPEMEKVRIFENGQTERVDR